MRFVRFTTRDEQSGPDPAGPGTGTRIFLPGLGAGPRPKFFFTRTSTKIFSEQGQDQNIFDWNPHPKFVPDGTRTKILNFFFTGTKNHWYRSCHLQLSFTESRCFYRVESRGDAPSWEKRFLNLWWSKIINKLQRTLPATIQTCPVQIYI